MMILDKGEDLNFMYCLCEGTYVNASDTSKPLICKSCEKPSHRNCTFYSGPDDDFECSLCKVQLLDPFNSVVEFLWYGRMGNKNTAFRVDAPNLEKWLSSNKEVYVISLPLSKNKLMHEWPKTFELKVNGEIVHVVKEPSWEHTRRDNPIKITYAMQTGENLMEIFSTTYNESGPLFLVVFMLSKQVTVQRMIETISKRRTVPFDDSKKRIVELINAMHDDDEVICMEQNHKIELNCPITMDRMELPARGNNCKHFQCFDLNGYLHVMQNTSTFNARWKCPECQLIIKPMDLVIDGYVLNILQSTPQSVSAVELDKCGNYKCIETEKSWDDPDYYAELEAVKRVSNISNKDVCSSVYSTSVLLGKGTKSSPTESKFNPNLCGGVYIKREQVDAFKPGCVIDLESEESNTAMQKASLGFTSGEIICLDSSDDDVKPANPTVASRISRSEPPHGDELILSVNPSTGALGSKVAGANIMIHTDGHTQTNRGPPTTLSQRLTQLPRIAETPKSSANGAATCLNKPISSTITKGQASESISTTKATASTLPNKGSTTTVKLTNRKPQLLFSPKRFTFFK